MLRKLILPAVLLSSAIPSTLLAQDPQPSLGDVARQARKGKEKNAGTVKRIITDDNLPSSKALAGLSDVGDSRASGNAAVTKGVAALDQVEATLNKLDPLERSTLAKAVLLSNDVEFPGRRAWEDKLYAAKQYYVSHVREIIQEARRLLADAQSLRAVQGGQQAPSADDPRSQEITRRFRAILEDAVRTDSAYQAVVVEGWDRAKEAKR